jgi:hypothetical protein
MPVDSGVMSIPVHAEAMVDGMVRTSVNLGAGYQYKVLLDNTAFTLKL